MARSVPLLQLDHNQLDCVVRLGYVDHRIRAPRSLPCRQPHCPVLTTLRRDLQIHVIERDGKTIVAEMLMQRLANIRRILAPKYAHVVVLKATSTFLG